MADVWIGLFDVAPQPGIDLEGAGAYVKVELTAGGGRCTNVLLRAGTPCLFLWL